MTTLILRLTITAVLFSASALPQQAVNSTEVHAGPTGAPASREDQTNQTPPAQSESDYVLGPGDLLTLTVPDIDDQYVDKTFRIDMSGEVTIPLAGRLPAAGLTSRALEQAIADHLKTILNNPQVVVNVFEFHSQPVSVIGEVNFPGLHQVQGQKNLLGALSLGGGFTDNLGSTITITRSLKWGRVPLPGAHDDSTGQYSVANVSVRDVLRSSKPEDNIPVMPDDVIAVSRADVVYAVGSVNKPGGFQLGQNETLSTLQVLSLAEGLNHTALPEKAVILRSVQGTPHKAEIPVDVKKLMAGRGPDVPLHADDILFIPNSTAKTAAYRSIEAILQTATGVAIYGRY